MKQKIYLFLIALLMLMTPKTSSAFILKMIEEAYNIIPISPVINFGEDIAETGKLLNKTALKVQKLANQIKGDIISIRSAIHQFIENPFGANFLTANLMGHNNVKICGVNVGTYDAQARQQENKTDLSLKLREVFLRYDVGQRHIVERNRRNFYLRNVYNIYAATQVLKYNLSAQGEVAQVIDNAKMCSGEGDGTTCGLPATSKGGNNEMIAAYAQALGALETIIKEWERVAALKAQLKALDIIIDMEPRQNIPHDRSSMLDIPNLPVFNSYTIANSQPLGFAQIVYNDLDSDFGDIVEEAGDNEPTGNYNSYSLKYKPLQSKVYESPMRAKMAELDSYNDLEDLEQQLSQIIDLHNTLHEFDSYVETAKRYKEAQETYKKKLAILRDSNQCGINYIGKYFNNPEITWSGKHLTPEEINQYDQRSGVSRYAIDVYDVAKALNTSDMNEALDVYQQQQNNPDSPAIFDPDSAIENLDAVTGVSLEGADAAARRRQENIATGDNNIEEHMAEDTLSDKDIEGGKGVVELDELEEDKLNDAKQNSYDSGGGVSSDVSKRTQDENRRATLIAWQVGALASESLSTQSGWGDIRTDNKMIWNDVKIFYNQYLTRKYYNIEKYLKNRHIAAEIVDIFVSLLNGENMSLGNTPYQLQLNKLYEELDAQLNTIYGNNFANDETKADQNLITKRNDKQKEIDDLVLQINDLKKTISDGTKKAEDSGYMGEDTKVIAGVNYLIDDNNQDLTAPKQDTTSENLNTNVKNLKDKYSLNDLNTELGKLEELLKQAEAELFKIQDEIVANIQKKQEELSASAPANAASVIAAFEKKLGKIQTDYNKDVNSRLQSALSTIAQQQGQQVANEIAHAIGSVSQGIINRNNNLISAIIDKARNKLQEMRDNNTLYLPQQSSYEQIDKIHQDMINELKLLTITETIAGFSISNMAVFADVMLADTNPDNDFFVGAYPRQRDLTSPRHLNDYAQPPVREIVHFDMTDFTNIKPYSEEFYDSYKGKKKEKKRALSRGDFLNYGHKVPEIWKEMLKPLAFVESEFNLHDALNQGCEEVAFLRGGVMPCRVAGSDIVLDVHVEKNKQGVWEYQGFNGADRPFMQLKDANAADYPKCLLMNMEEGAPHLSFYTKKVKYKKFAKAKPPALKDCKYSELGMLLDADKDNKLYFRQTLFEVFLEYLRVSEERSEGESTNKKEENYMAIAQQAELSRNQIGDFLRQAEAEKKLLQSLEEIKQKNQKQLDELREKLQKLSQKFEHTISADTDLSDEDQAKDVKAALKNVKKGALNKIEIPQASEDKSEAYKNRLQKISDIKYCLEIDGASNMAINMGINKEEFEKELKTAEVNNKLSERYDAKKRKKGKKSPDGDEYRDLEEAYCANY